MAFDTNQTFISTALLDQNTKPYQLPTNFAVQEFNSQHRYKSFMWDDFLLTTFEKNHRPFTDDREYMLFKFDGYYYHQVWQGYIPKKNIEAGYQLLWLRGIIQSPDGKSFVVIISNNRVFILKSNKCSQLIQTAQFEGLGLIYYSPSTKKYYGMLSKQVSQQDRQWNFTFTQVSLNFNKSGGLPAKKTDIRGVYTKIISFTVSKVGTKKNLIPRMISPNMLIFALQNEKSNGISILNIYADCGWKHTLKEGQIVTHILHFDLEKCLIRRLPRLTHSNLLSINPKNYREMIYHSGRDLCLLVASESGIELEEIIEVPSGDFYTISYCLFYHSESGSVFHWSFAKRKLTLLKNHIPRGSEFRISSVPGILCYVGNKHISLRQSGFLEQLALSGGNLSAPVSRLISKFLMKKYSAP
jgi:hypothetical protein